MAFASKDAERGTQSKTDSSRVDSSTPVGEEGPGADSRHVPAEQGFTGLTAQQRQDAAALSKTLSSAFGQIVSIFMRSPARRDLSLADLELAVLPALTAGQVSIAEAQSKVSGLMTPMAVILWASVSPEVDERIAAQAAKPVLLGRADWTSGDIIWVMEAIGERRVLGEMFRRLAKDKWQGKRVKVRTRRSSGKSSAGNVERAPEATSTLQ